MRNVTSFKQCAVLGLLGFALVSACSDEEDGAGDGTSGKSPGAGTSNAGTSTAGTSAGSTTAGSSAGGMAGSGGSSSGGTGGSKAGSAPMGGEPSDGGMPGMGGMGEMGGMVGEMGGVGGAGDTEPMGGAGGAGEVPFDVLDNPGWETGTPKALEMPGWTNEGTPGAAYIEYSSPHTGFGRLGHWTMWVDQNSPPYTARTYQTVEPIANGTYSFSVWVDRNWFEEQYLFARDHDIADSNAEMTQDTDEAETPDGYVKITLSGIVVTSGKITVGIYSAAPAGTYANFDDAELTLE
jgi:hypothetical protein